MSYNDMLLAGFSAASSPKTASMGFGSLLGTTTPESGELALASLLGVPTVPCCTPLNPYSLLESALTAPKPEAIGLASLLAGLIPSQKPTQPTGSVWPPGASLNAYGPLSPFFTAGTALGWVAVRKRFEQFHQDLALTPSQVADGTAKRGNVVGCLNRAYYKTSSETDSSFFVGSWGKDTAIRPPRDVDLYFVLPRSVYYRFQAYIGNRQSALLQEIKGKLALAFPKTDMSGDGQVVMVNFGTYSVEVVPAFELTQGRYWICDTNNGGSYKETGPWQEASQLDAADAANARNLRPLVRMLKAWQAHCSVPIKSFHLELVATEFLAKSPWRLNDWFYFDWITRDFFAYLYHRANGSVIVPGTLESIALGNEWQSRVQTAYDRAVKACDFERDNRVHEAGDQWQMIFGEDIPRTV